MCVYQVRCESGQGLWGGHWRCEGFVHVEVTDAHSGDLAVPQIAHSAKANMLRSKDRRRPDRGRPVRHTRSRHSRPVTDTPVQHTARIYAYEHTHVRARSVHVHVAQPVHVHTWHILQHTPSCSEAYEQRAMSPTATPSEVRASPLLTLTRHGYD